MASILLVIGNDDHAALTRAALASLDQMLQVERAASTDEFLAALHRKSYDAIVLDYEPSEGNGTASLQEVMGAAHGVPVILITSCADEETAIEAVKNGAYDYVCRTDNHLMKLPLVIQRAMKEHKAATEEARLKTRIEESERIRILGQMTSGIDHDLNNILATILGQTELMLMGFGGEEEIARGLRIIQKAAQSGADIVKRIQKPAKAGSQQEFAKPVVSDVVRGAASRTTELRRANVLVIDDEDIIRDLLKNILSGNHNVITAADGITGISAFRNGDYDIIFTDLGMPEVSGWEVAEQTKAIDPNVKVVLITGWGVQLSRDELEERKIDSIITKPFKVSEILNVVEEALKSRQE